MKFPLSSLVIFLCSSAAIAGSSSDFTYTRLDKNNAALLVVDHQVGLFHLVRDMEPTKFRSNIFAHAALGKVFSLPTVLTTSASTGPNGPLPKEIIEMHPEAPLVSRQGEVNAWDNEDFRAAVKATGKKQIILAGIVTDVCTAFLALSLRAAGYEVYANSEASGTFNPRIAEEANQRMREAGVHVLSSFAIACELMRDWRNTPGTAELFPYFDKYLPEYGYLARAHGYAVLNGTLSPGQEQAL